MYFKQNSECKLNIISAKLVLNQNQNNLFWKNTFKLKGY